MVTVDANTILQAEAQLNPSMEREGRYEVPTLAEELLATDSNLTESEGESVLNCRSSLVGVRPHIQEYMGSTN